MPSPPSRRWADLLLDGAKKGHRYRFAILFAFICMCSCTLAAGHDVANQSGNPFLLRKPPELCDASFRDVRDVWDTHFHPRFDPIPARFVGSTHDLHMEAPAQYLPPETFLLPHTNCSNPDFGIADAEDPDHSLLFLTGVLLLYLCGGVAFSQTSPREAQADQSSQEAAKIQAATDTA